MTGIELIAKERKRQIEKEGWTAQHDARHIRGELALAAIAYIWHRWSNDKLILHMYWPWDETWWKPKDTISNLVKAGALIAAEIDRLQALKEKE